MGAHDRISRVNDRGTPMLSKGVSVDVDGATEFDELYAEVGPRLWRSILAFTGGRRDLTDDVVAEAFLRTLESGENVRDRAAYVYRIAFRLAAHELARVSDSRQIPEVAIQDDPGLAELFDALRSLSPSERAALYLRYQVDLPVAEIADILGSSAGAVRVHLFRGRRKLAALLGGENDD
jgi:RNA polymerase sigma-70 factor (ECF subfamily)